MFTNFTSHSKRKAYQKFIARFMLQCYLMIYCLLAKCISHKLHNETYPISNKSYLFFDIIQLPNSDSDKVFRVLYISYKVLRDCICTTYHSPHTRQMFIPWKIQKVHNMELHHFKDFLFQQEFLQLFWKFYVLKLEVHISFLRLHYC